MRTQIRTFLLMGITLPCLAQAAENTWTNINSGKWETNSNWSLGVAPSISQSFTSITNAPSKTVAIDAVTETFPGTLTISNLTLFAPVGSANSLFLNNPGTGTPLRVLRSIFLNARSTLVLFSNAVVEAAAAGLGDTLNVADGAFVNVLGGGSLIVTNGTMFIGSPGNCDIVLNTGTIRALSFSLGNLGAGTFTFQAGLAEVRSALTLAPSGLSTGTIWMSGGQLVATNALTTIGDGGVGRLILSNGIVNVSTALVARFSFSSGTLAVAGGTFTAERLVATNSGANIQFTGGNMTLRGAVVNNLNTFGGSGRSAVLNLVAGTNDLSGEMDVATGANSTGVVWVVGGQLVATNNFALTLLGLNGVGQMTISNGNNWIGDMVIGQNGGSRGTWTIAGGTNQITTELLIGAGSTSTGVVLLTGGQLVVTNNNIVTAVGYSANGEMTVFPNGKLLSSRLSVGFGSGSRGTFTLAGATLDLPTTVNGVTVGENVGATGTVWLSTGSLIVTNFAVESVVGLAGTGQMAVSNAFLRTSDFRVGRNASSRGTLTMAGGTNQFDSFLSIGTLANATGTVWVTGGLVVVTNNIISLGVGSARLVVSNGTVLAKQLSAGTNGIVEFPGGIVTLSGADVATDLVFGGAGRQAVLNLVAGTNQFGGDLGFANEVGGTGTLWLTGGQLIVTNGGTFAGLRGVGSMTVSNGTWRAREGNVGAETGSQGTLTIAGGTNVFAAFLNIGLSAAATGSLWMTGGQLTVTNQSISVSVVGVGQMIVSNGTVTARAIFMGDNPNARGSMTVAGGTVTVLSEFDVGSGGTHTCLLNGGQINVSTGLTTVGFFDTGQMTVSNGTWLTRAGIIGNQPGSRGTLAIAGGTSSVFSNMTLGTFDCAATGIVNVTAGSLFVTNAAGNATLEVRSGTFTMSGGTVKIDKLVVTNACGRFIHTGGTLSISATNLLPNLDVAGDGLPWSWKQQFGFDVFDPAVAGTDSDGDGFNNLQEFLAGTDPTNSASYFHITNIMRTGNDLRVTWMMGPGKTNALERTAGAAGSFATNGFTAIFIATNTVGTITNYLDVGGATNKPARYYRVRLVP